VSTCPSIGPGEDAIGGLQVNQVEFVDQSVEFVSVLIQVSGDSFFLVQVPNEVIIAPYDPKIVSEQAIEIIQGSEEGLFFPGVGWAINISEVTRLVRSYESIVGGDGPSSSSEVF
jgi:hypothetical protein